MHIILYVLDALRADHLGCYGYHRATSPHIDELAADGVVFEKCFTSTTWTRPVAATLLTGVYPTVHRTRTRAEMFSVALPRLPEILSMHDFHTSAYVTMGNIAGDIGFGRGFNIYHDLFRDPAILAKRQKLDKVAAAMMHVSEEVALPRAEDVNDYLFTYLSEHITSNTFNFIWSIEPHVPYNAPNEFNKFAPAERVKLNEGEQDDIRSATAADAQRLIDRYDDEIYYNDHCIGRIIAHLKQLGIYDDTLFIVIGDHGEAFHEHGVYTHGHAPYEEVIHVPCVMKLPANRYAGTRVGALAALVDILPTILSVADIEMDTPTAQGYNLLPLAAKKQTQVRDYVFSDTQALEIHNRYLSVRDKRWKLIQTQKPKRDIRTFTSTIQHIRERQLFRKILRSPVHFFRNYFRKDNVQLFDLMSDPEEQVNVALQYPERVVAMQNILHEWIMENERLSTQIGDIPANQYEESDDLRQHLEKLGYL